MLDPQPPHFWLVYVLMFVLMRFNWVITIDQFLDTDCVFGLFVYTLFILYQLHKKKKMSVIINVDLQLVFAYVFSRNPIN
jgi:hypothetical protein